MEIFLLVLFVLAALCLSILLLFSRKKNVPAAGAMPSNYRELLAQHVDFYTDLAPGRKIEFENRMQQFLSHVRITGVGVAVEELDRVLIAASAIIPIFGFPDWEYINLREVLVYPDSFNMEFEQRGPGRSTLGMVGTGPYQNVMILSQHELRQGFLNKTGKSNTAIHEFVHLLDKTDGSVDGIPELLLSRQYIIPWLNLIHREIKNIQKDKSDINPYGATNESEFFAVVAEYFFERPDLLADKHPELYELLVKIFRQQPSAASSTKSTFS